MKIDLICHDGSPLGVIPSDIYGKGVGGAELAMMSLMETFAKRGHQVRVYNNPSVAGDHSGVNYLSKQLFVRRERRDILIVFRSPNPMLVSATARYGRFWWSTDQHTVGDFRALASMVDFCVTISPYHTDYHQKYYNIEDKKIGHIDLGVRMEDYSEPVDKVKNRMIYCSVPDRGLQILHSSWPLILKEIPDASLTITSDYTLWGVGARNQAHRLNWVGLQGVKFLGNIARERMVRLQQEAEIMPYPCTYDELFCLSVAECQVAGAFPVTTSIGALETTNAFGIKTTGDLKNPTMLREAFVDRIVALLTTDREYLETRVATMKAGAAQRFDWNKIADRWEYLFKEGKLPR